MKVSCALLQVRGFKDYVTGKDKKRKAMEQFLSKYVVMQRTLASGYRESISTLTMLQTMQALASMFPPLCT